MDKWQSAGLHQHPSPLSRSIYGQVCLTGAGIYYFRRSGVDKEWDRWWWDCPQDWASKIHQEENISILREACEAEGTPFTRAVVNIQQKEDCSEPLPEWRAEEES